MADFSVTVTRAGTRTLRLEFDGADEQVMKVLTSLPGVEPDGTVSEPDELLASLFGSPNGLAANLGLDGEYSRFVDVAAEAGVTAVAETVAAAVAALLNSVLEESYSVVITDRAVDEKAIQKLKREIEKKIHERYKKRIQRLEKTIRELKKLRDEGLSAMLPEAITIVATALQNGWEIDAKRQEFVLPRVELRAVTVIDKDGPGRLKVIALPKKLRGKFYAEGVRVSYASPTVRVVTVDDSYHPNVEDGNVCLGALAGRPLAEVLRELPHALEVANLTSAWPNEAFEELIRELGLKIRAVTDDERETEEPDFAIRPADPVAAVEVREK